MNQETVTEEQYKVHNAVNSLCRWKIKATRVAAVFALAIFLTVPVSALLFSPAFVQAQDVNYPDPQLPANNATDVPLSPVFQWKPWYAGAEEYTLELSDNINMGNPQTIIVAATVYKYSGTLEYDTAYWWRVKATKPDGGVKSPQFRFVTIAESTSSAGDEPPAESSFRDSIREFFEDPDWFLIGLIAAAIVVVVIAVYILMKPRKPQTSQNRWSGVQSQGAGGQQMSACPACGSRNPPGRKFCNNCGTNLIGGAQQQPWSAQQPAACPACGSQNPAGRKFCNNCGASLFGGAQQQSSTQQPAACPACGSQDTEGQKFCSNCGASLLSGAQQQSLEIHQAFSCPICGATITVGVNPCSNCGTWLDWQA